MQLTLNSAKGADVLPITAPSQETMENYLQMGYRSGHCWSRALPGSCYTRVSRCLPELCTQQLITAQLTRTGEKGSGFGNSLALQKHYLMHVSSLSPTQGLKEGVGCTRSSC